MREVNIMGMKIAIIGNGKTGPAAQEKRMIQFLSDIDPNTDLSFIQARDIRFVHKDEVPRTRDAIYTEIIWPSKQWQRGYVQIMNKELDELVGNSVAAQWGPPHIKIFHLAQSRVANGHGVWKIGFHANSILAQKYVLMSDQEFKVLCGKWADWEKIMKGEEGKLPHIY